MIELKSASLRYDDAWVLRDINMQIQRGAFVSLLGPSGCGKSTLLRLTAGLVPASDGKVLIDGRPAQQYRKQSDGIALVFQEPRLLPWRNVERNIGLPLELLAVDGAKQQQLITSSIELIGLQPEDSRKYPRMLSGGMRMRVALARALVTQPRVLLLDEPFAALDDLLRQQLNEELLRIWQTRSPTTLFVTHNVAEAIFLSQRVVVMGIHPGRVKAEIEVPFDYPRERRLRATPEFGQLVGLVSDALRGDTHEVA
jgi:NitT/TauT family transport system ATP-binding protein